MKIKEEFLLEDVEEVLKNNLTAVIMGSSLHEERCEKIKNVFGKTNAKMFFVDYDFENRKYKFNIVENNFSPISNIPINCFSSFFNHKIRNYAKNVLIDLTSLQHSVIIVLLNILCNQIKPAHLFASYIKPKRYINKDKFGKYNFSIKIYEPAGIAGLIRQRKENEIVIPFLGFEGARLNNILESMNYEQIVPVIGFPAEDPTWQFDSLRNCRQVLEDTCPNAEIKKCQSNSIYDAIDILDEITSVYSDKNFVLLPLGIRTHTAACGLWAAKHKNVRILYDYVVETEKRTEGIGEALIYHLSKFI